MNNFKQPVIALFPTPVAKVPLPPYAFFDREFSFLKTMEIRSDRQDEENHLVRRTSVNSYVLDLPELQALRHYINEQINVFAYEVLCHKQQYQITQSWTNLNKPGEYTHKHGHPNSIISAVLYIDVPNGINSIRFHRNDERGGSYSFKIETESTRIKDSMFAFEWASMDVQRGDLLIFPSFLNHSVPINNTPHDRLSLALNSVPKFFLGTEETLTHLLLGNVSELNKNRQS